MDLKIVAWQRAGSLVLVLIGATAAAADNSTAASDTGGRGHGDLIRADGAAKAATRGRLMEAFPGVQFYEGITGVQQVYGRPFGAGASAEESAAAFVRTYAPALGVNSFDLAAGSLTADGRRTQGVMFDRTTGAYKFTLVYYSQEFNKVPVFRGELRLLVRNEAGYPLVLANSALRDLGGFARAPNFARVAEETGRAAARALVPGLVTFTKPAPVIYAGVDDQFAPPTAAVVFEGSSPFPERWLFVADAATGAILYSENRLVDVNVTGNVSGVGTPGSASEQCATEITMAMPYARVNIGATVAFANASGNFTITNAGTTPVTVQSPVRGQWFWVHHWPTPDTVLSQSVTPPGPANFTHNAANTEFPRAEVNGYLSANTVRDFTLVYNPTYPGTNITDFPVYVNRTDGFCPGNAWYDPGLVSLNFCQAGGGSPNTAWTSVAYHEYGHHLVQTAGSGQGAYGEGMGDVMSVLILDEPELGLGFFGSCTTPLRNADNTCQYQSSGCSSCGSEIHVCGQVLSGCVWDTRDALAVTNPSTYIDILADLSINSMLLHTGSSITPTITTDFLTLDDNDGNLGNGTPHSTEINTGFGAHNMAPLPPPGNDACASSITLCPGSVTGTTIGATDDGDSSCGTSSTSVDVWYRYVPGSSGTATVSTCTGTNYDTVLSVHSGCPGTTGNQLPGECDDDTCAPGGGSSVTFSVTSGTSYWVRVTGWNGSAGNFTLTLTGPSCTACNPPSCDDSNPCTTDTCNAGTCVNTNNTLPCNDGNACTTNDACSGGTCVGGPAPNCDDSNVCTNDSCNTSTGCVHTNNTSPCNDANACTTNDTCSGGTCVGGPAPNCNDSNACTNDSCNTATGCVNTNNTNSCNDGNACTTNDACSGGSCVGGPPLNCDDSNACTTDSCNTGSGCVHTNNTGACSDGNACTIGDACSGGNCVPGSPVNCSGGGDECSTAACDPAGAPGNCDDTTPTNEGLPCSSGTGTCGSGVCVRTRVFMARLGEQASAPPVGATTLEVEPGTTTQVDVWLRDGAGTQLLNGYQIMIPWNATLVSGSGAVQYVDVPPTGSAGNSVRLDTTRSDWVFAGQPLQMINYQEIVNSRSGMIYNLSVSSGINASPLGIRYLGQIAVASQAGACGEFSLPFRLTLIPVSQLFIPFGNVFNVDLFQPLTVIVGSPNDDCADSIPLSGINVVQNFNSTCATQDGAAHAGCDLDKDIWYEYTAACTGDLTVDTLTGCSFDSDVAVYEDGSACVPGDGNLASCDDTTGACDSVTIPVVFGDTLLIRVGSAAGASGPGTLTVHCESIVGPCDEASDCADINFNTVRDDPCVWWSCNASTCQGANVLFADMGGVNGNCVPDGSADVNDKFHALNCFSDTNFGAPGEYPCEPEGPVFVYNVDAGGAGLTCCPDGTCDANDAFAALNAFSGTSLCAICPQNTAVCVGGGEPGIPCGNDASCQGGSCVIQDPGSHPCPPGGPSPMHMPPPVGHATITASADQRLAQPGDLISVSVFMDNALRDLRGYQLHLSVTGGFRGRLELVDISVHDRKDHAFASAGYFDAFNVRTAQMIAGLDGDGVTTAKNGYLATYTYRVSSDAAGTFVVDVLGYAPASPERRTFLFASGNGTISLDGTMPAAVVVGGRK